MTTDALTPYADLRRHGYAERFDAIERALDEYDSADHRRMSDGDGTEWVAFPDNARRGSIIASFVVRRARIVRRVEEWNDRSARLFACDCADDALKFFENPDPRSVEAVAVARRYAIGDATFAELADAGDAARAAASAAAWAAAGDAAAWAVARNSALAAAWAAVGCVAWDAARATQARRLATMLGIEEGNDGR